MKSIPYKQWSLICFWMMLFQTTDDHDTLSVFSVFEFPKHSHYMCIISLNLHINIFINPVILWYKNKKLRPRQ